MLIIGFMVFVVGWILIICYPFNKRKNARCSAQTQGELVKILRRRSSDGPSKDAHIYAYQVDGVEYHLKTVEHSLEVKQVGDACPVWYNPAKPKDAQAFRPSDKYLKVILRVGLGLVLLGFVLTCVGFYLQFL